MPQVAEEQMAIAMHPVDDYIASFAWTARWMHPTHGNRRKGDSDFEKGNTALYLPPGRF
jgi:hypothetical protein